MTSAGNGRRGAERTGAPVAALVEEAGRAAGLLALREAQLVAARHTPRVRRRAQGLAVALGAAIAFLTAFALANWGAVVALSGPLPAWGAPLALATTWCVVGGLLLAVLAASGRVAGWRRAWLPGVRPTSVCEQARDEARRDMTESLARLAGAVGDQAAAGVASAVVPVVAGVVGAGEHLIDRVDEITDELEEAVPGGGVVNRLSDLALVPGRLLIGAARTTLEGARRR